MRVLITGITGFAGSHLVDYILKEHPDVEIFGIRRWRSRTETIKHFQDDIKIVECELRDLTSVFKVVQDIRPDRIFHLAAQSFVPTSWASPADSLNTNIIGQLNIFEAVRSLEISPWIQIACSSEEYGMVYDNEVPITESNPLRPLSPYAVSKVGQDMMGYQYSESYGMKIIRTRGFNHTGPRRGDVFVCSDFAKQIVDIEKKKRPPVIKVGNLEAKRDFTDVRDMVRAYWLALDGNCAPGEVYNIASGTTHTIQSVLDRLLSMTDAAITVEEDSARLRPSDVQILLGDYSRFKAATGWEPTIPFEQTLQDILDYWRARD
ncbi:GDP-mannose 4,6-dehydratase [candidate division KSB3 bacterium]|uniref:GDP-mannose 4,6-dehydratase n=1 Tax=candidate division KSB3 bacterium TaxID=2044937 RepID=A0A2G6EAB4_9BACT|nr:MAG: GDP-mannose 4,6-dehydratase [candidate division KSB3 bacterium]PIE30806.1 MAG: GDP-mannose 4,6-dehydratase [candidate division KSB3 bacterium]